MQHFRGSPDDIGVTVNETKRSVAELKNITNLRSSKTEGKCADIHVANYDQDSNQSVSDCSYDGRGYRLICKAAGSGGDRLYSGGRPAVKKNKDTIRLDTLLNCRHEVSRA